MAAAVEQLRNEGIDFSDEALAHLPPSLYGHINPYGRYRFGIDHIPGRHQLRPLRQPGDSA